MVCTHVLCAAGDRRHSNIAVFLIHLSLSISVALARAFIQFYIFIQPYSNISSIYNRRKALFFSFFLFLSSIFVCLNGNTFLMTPQTIVLLFVLYYNNIYFVCVSVCVCVCMMDSHKLVHNHNHVKICVSLFLHSFLVLSERLIFTLFFRE